MNKYLKISTPMFESEIINIDGVGPVLFERSMRARRLNITVRPLKGVRVAVPSGLSFKRAVDFAGRRSGWIKRHLTRLEMLKKRQIAMAATLPEVDPLEGRKMLKERLHELAIKHGFSYSMVSIRNQKTRWGSCSHKNSISLNIKLASLPKELSDYVILHELVHTRIKNHGKAFRTELDRLTGDSRALDAELKEYSLAFL